MGILNVTPDSFSDGGQFFDVNSAVERALRMQDEGADIIDVGGESTRPGAGKITVKEEIRRVIPVIKALAKEVTVPISIDTYKSAVAEAAVSSGASMINDISGLRFDARMAKVAARHEVPVVVMHIKGTPENMQKNPVYKSLVPEIVKAETEHSSESKHQHVAALKRLTTLLYKNSKRLERSKSNGRDYIPMLQKELKQFRRLQRAWMLNL